MVISTITCEFGRTIVRGNREIVDEIPINIDLEHSYLVDLKRFIREAKSLSSKTDIRITVGPVGNRKKSIYVVVISHTLFPNCIIGVLLVPNITLHNQGVLNASRLFCSIMELKGGVSLNFLFEK